MLYYWLKFLMRIALSVYYRKRHYIGFENVPATGPVIFACNHPNSFLDAMIIGAHLKRETHFLARSDVFNTPLKLWILSQFKMMPIYRLSEGKEDLGKNKDTFDKCHAVFRKGGAVLMFSEGLCIQEMRLRPLKKGTARIAMEYSKDGSPLMIIPTGLNYFKPTKAREDIMIAMDAPFNAADIAAEYNENQAKGIQTFNKKLTDGLHNSVIDIRDKKNEKAIEQLVEVEYNNGADLKKLISIVNLPYGDHLNLLYEYRAALEKNKLRDEAVAGKSSNILLAIPATLAFGLAFWLYIIPVGLADYLVKKKVKLAEFHDSVLIGAAVVFSFVFWMIAFAVVSSIFNVLLGIELMLVFLLMILLAGPGWDVMSNVRNASIFKNHPDRSKLEEQREQISKLSSSVLDLVQAHQAHHPVG